jgi:hypothetical protein
LYLAVLNMMKWSVRASTARKRVIAIMILRGSKISHSLYISVLRAQRVAAVRKDCNQNHGLQLHTSTWATTATAM